MSDLSRYIAQLKAEDWLSPLYDAEIAKEVEPERWTVPAAFARPSAAGGPCARDIELYLLGHRTARDARSVLRMENGSWAHRRITARFARMGILAEDSARRTLTDEDGTELWSGESDLVVRRPGAAVLNIGEIKTANSFRFRKLPAQDQDWALMARAMLKAEPSYTRQLTQYVQRFQDLRLSIADEAFFYFEDTDSQAWRIIWIKPDAAVRRNAFANAELAVEAAQRGELLAPPFKRDSLTCRACYRRRLCCDLQDGKEEPWARVTAALATA